VARFLGRNNVIEVMRLSSSKTSQAEFKALEGGHILHLPVRHDDLTPLNKPCFLAIRPEHVVLKESAAEDPSAENVLRGHIREIVFAGATSTIRVDANGLRLEVLVLDANGLGVGAECSVVLPPDDLSLLKQG
jgi:ABC-type Fe3+/spermidine/putrescine transport system ATPase subunit